LVTYLAGQEVLNFKIFVIQGIGKTPLEVQPNVNFNIIGHGKGKL
jgi:hypothetical protein